MDAGSATDVSTQAASDAPAVVDAVASGKADSGGPDAVVTLPPDAGAPDAPATLNSADSGQADGGVDAPAPMGSDAGAADLTPVATPVGVPNADPSSQLIDSKGGSLSTSDGRFTLTIPPGAVSAPTNFTIQPLTNQAYGGIGSAYDLGPEGISLAAPATLSFHIPSPQAGAAYGVAFQDGQQRWQLVDGATFDATSTIISANVSHFSTWSLVVGIQLTPLAAAVLPGKTVQLTVISCVKPASSDPQQGFSKFLFECAPDPQSVLPATWAVNGITGGNATSGTVAGTNSGATYTAPSKAPNPTTVAVYVEALDESLAPLVVASDVQLAPLVPPSSKTLIVSNITINSCVTDDDPCGARCISVHPDPSVAGPGR